MKKTLFAIICAISCVGCINFYTRMPGTNARIERIYQSTWHASGIAWIIAFPQIMSPIGDGHLCLANVVSIPCGLVIGVDALVEAVIDTVCLPVDMPLAKSRSGKFMAVADKMDGDSLDNIFIRIEGDDMVVLTYDKVGGVHEFKMSINAFLNALHKASDDENEEPLCQPGSANDSEDFDDALPLFYNDHEWTKYDEWSTGKDISVTEAWNYTP